MANSLFIDVHILQTVPPSNINRDDTGSPKSARFGGVKRARVSSQAWKKATRDLFPDMLNEDEIGQRTKYAVDMIAECIDNLLPNVDREQVRDAAEKVLSATGVKVTDGATGYLLFVAPGQARALAELAVESIGAGEAVNKKAAREIFDIKKNPPAECCRCCDVRANGCGRSRLECGCICPGCTCNRYWENGARV